MFTHEQIWRGIDLMAAHAQTSPSGLARRAGLDATTFNPSKRVSADGAKQRWPSTESLAKAMSAANLDFAGFAALVMGQSRKGLETKGLRSFDLAEQPHTPVFRLSGQLAGGTELPTPQFDPDRHQSVRVKGDEMSPLYRDGDILILDISAAPTTGDRVFCELRTGETGAFELRALEVQSIKLRGLTPNKPDRVIRLEHLATMMKIVWASQ